MDGPAGVHVRDRGVIYGLSDGLPAREIGMGEVERACGMGDLATYKRNVDEGLVFVSCAVSLLLMAL